MSERVICNDNGGELREEVVRCRNCKNYAVTPMRGSRCFHWITLDCFENPIPSEVKPDGFCAWGERRGE